MNDKVDESRSHHVHGLINILHFDSIEMSLLLSSYRNQRLLQVSFSSGN